MDALQTKIIIYLVGFIAIVCGILILYQILKKYFPNIRNLLGIILAPFKFLAGLLGKLTDPIGLVGDLTKGITNTITGGIDNLTGGITGGITDIGGGISSGAGKLSPF
jgi:hypothetical protein